METAAAEWLCERDEGFSPERARAFAVWRDADGRHAAAVERVERSLGLLAEMPAVRAPLEARFGPVDGAAAPAARRRRIFPVWTAGLAAALALGAALLWRPVAGPEPAGIQTYVTQADAPQRVELADGSVVNLNGRSELRVRYSAGTRAVTLAAGEAHFEVAHDKARPFVVTADGVAVRAVGTAFNVRLAAAAVEVLVTEGRVAVTPPVPAADAGPAAPTSGGSEMGAGERASVARREAAPVAVIARAEPAEIREALAWHSRAKTFSDVPLRDVVAQFNLRNTVQLVAEGELGDRRIGGSFAFDQVEAFVRLLQQDGDIVALRRGENEIVLRRAR